DWGDNQNNEARAAYWRTIEMSGPDTNIAVAKLRGYNQFVSIPRSKAMMVQSVTAWEQVGGSQEHTVSGRPTCIDFDPKFNSTIYLGTSGGGLWKTTDGGSNWSSLSDSWSSYAMGGVAVDPTNGNIIYACTGDLYDRTGDGLYKSVDGGLNWVHLVDANVTSVYCNQVLIDPQVHTTIYLTGRDGVRRSLDAGQTWKKIVGISGVTHMVIDPTNGQNLYAGGGGVILKSTDGGNTWSSSDLASNIDLKSTVTLGISKSDVSKIYASIGNGDNTTVGLALSSDYGSTWNLVNSTQYMSNQSFYDNACAVNPGNANTVLVGGLDIYSSTNGGTILNQRTDWRSSSSQSNFSHADIHVLAYSPYNQLYALTDGGVFSSGNNGGIWSQSKNSSLSTMLFVGGDAASDFSFIVGGAQDNGINRANNGDKAFAQTLGGDGGRCFISQVDGQFVYSTYIGPSLQKSGDGGKSWDYGPNPADPNNIIPLGSRLLSEINRQSDFYMTYDVCETDPGFLAIAGFSNVYYSNDGCTSLYQLPGKNVITGKVKAVHVADADHSVVYAGSTSGFAYVVTNAEDLTGSIPWTKSTTQIGTASGFVTDPNDASKVWASISGYGSKHFWRSTDYGKTWEAPATNLPDLDASTIARAPNGDLFIGHAFGVMRSIDNGMTWEPLRDGIPLCQVTKLRVRGTSSEYLLATTYGRGMYRINIKDLPRTIVTTGVSASSSSASDMPAFIRISPNPVQLNGRLSVSYRIPKDGDVSLLLYDELGREVRTLLKEFRPQGEQIAEADISSLPSGIYYAVLTSDGHAVTQKLTVAK
ncbi:MAG: T9SS type A sorting domain-containing protein, partial [Candidatus Kapaibacterium sp.]